MKRTFVLLLVLALVLVAILPAAAQGGPRQVWVRSGDTWTSTAYRLGVPICSLATANGFRRCSGIYRASSALMVGQTLEVPYAH